MSDQLSAFMLSPWGWGVSFVAGFWMVRRARAALR
jgi:hypothetical protein